MIINEKFELEKFLNTKNKECIESFQSMWYYDLQKFYDDEILLYKNANSILKFFNSDLRIVDADYDDKNDCLIWNTESVK